jgi:hypothetical protein
MLCEPDRNMFRPWRIDTEWEDRLWFRFRRLILSSAISPKCCSSRSCRYSFSRRPGIRPSRSKERWKRSGNTVYWRAGEEDISLFQITSLHFHWLETCFMLPALSHLPYPQGNMLLIRDNACQVRTALRLVVLDRAAFVVALVRKLRLGRPDVGSFLARLRMRLRQRQSLPPSLLLAQHRLRKLVDQHLTLLVLRT